MKIPQRLSLSLAAVLIFSGVAMVTPVHAEQGVPSDHSISPSPPTPVKSSQIERNTSDEDGLHPLDLTKKLQQNGQAELQAEKAQVKEKSQADRAKACDARQSDIKKRMTGAVAIAQVYQTRFDNIFAKAKTYHDNDNVSVTDYDAMVSALNTDQHNTAASITSLKSLDVAIDCTSPDTAAGSVSAFREAVKTTRDDLKQYRADLVKLLQALKQAKTEGQ